MLIGCLHTAATNVPPFDAVAAGIEGVELRHVLRAEAEAELCALAADCDAVLLTCSSIGRAVEGVQDEAVPVIRVDAALAERAVTNGGRVVVLYAAPSTAAPTGQLFAAAAAKTGASIEMRTVPDAWTRFTSGDHEGYFALVAEATEAAYRDGADVVALAQVSMAGAADKVRVGPVPLTSPAIGLQAVIDRLGA